ncbi:hypothetical protein [Flavobacterium sp. GSP6]|uniref:hypothetical protein n=1 Tax=Flavobacterium sp. GSP6 TaxID=2497488 RepID=UPI000F89BABF|nr:hypothetical protein [Flavobacterium sp. GSP6]RTZ06768.1 hypothetical protein EKM03_06250 [Flavobacterium sp. GSP6]
MKEIILVTFLFNAIQANAQNIVEWHDKYQMQLSDFQSSATQIGNIKSIVFITLPVLILRFK